MGLSPQRNAAKLSDNLPLKEHNKAHGFRTGCLTSIYVCDGPVSTCCTFVNITHISLVRLIPDPILEILAAQDASQSQGTTFTLKGNLVHSFLILA